MKTVNSKIKLLFWPCVFVSCYIFNVLNIPAPWLLGSLVIGVLYSLLIGPRERNKYIFPIALALIGLSLGSMLDLMLLREAIQNFGFAILFGVVATLATGLILGYTLYNRTNLDFKTAIYSFVPGGASEVLGVAETNGADIRIVAAFHSARMILFVTFIPLLVGAGINRTGSVTIINDIYIIQDIFIYLILVIVTALVLYWVLPIPAGALLYSTLLTIIWSLFDESLEVPLLIAGLGQMMIGATIGLRFDLSSLKLIWSMKRIAMLLLAAFISLSILISAIFSVWTHVDIWSSILGWIPAGAGEMSSTAIFLKLDETSVITFQLIRLYTVFLTLPLLIKWLNKYSDQKNKDK